jgi:hypothetical protein
MVKAATINPTIHTTGKNLGLRTLSFLRKIEYNSLCVKKSAIFKKKVNNLENRWIYGLANQNDPTK